jgi:anti-sigma B factor antagonist
MNMSESVRVLVVEQAEHVVVSAHGLLYLDTMQPLQDALLVQVGRDRSHVILDLGAVRQCDSSGLNLFVKAHRLAGEHGGWFCLAAPRPAVRRLLDLTNLSRVLRVFDTVEQAANPPV